RTVRGAEAKLVDPAGVAEEGLLGNDPRCRELRVEHRLEVRTERAVAVGAHGTREEQAVTECEALLDVRAERAALGGSVVRQALCARGDGGSTRRQLTARGVRGAEDVAVELHTGRGLGAEVVGYL